VYLGSHTFSPFAFPRKGVTELSSTSSVLSSSVHGQPASPFLPPRVSFPDGPLPTGLVELPRVDAFLINCPPSPALDYTT